MSAGWHRARRCSGSAEGECEAVQGGCAPLESGQSSPATGTIEALSHAGLQPGAPATAQHAVLAAGQDAATHARGGPASSAQPRAGACGLEDDGSHFCGPGPSSSRDSGSGDGSSGSGDGGSGSGDGGSSDSGSSDGGSSDGGGDGGSGDGGSGDGDGGSSDGGDSSSSDSDSGSSGGGGDPGGGDAGGGDGGGDDDGGNRGSGGGDGEGGGGGDAGSSLLAALGILDGQGGDKQADSWPLAGCSPRASEARPAGPCSAAAGQADGHASSAGAAQGGGAGAATTTPSVVAGSRWPQPISAATAEIPGLQHVGGCAGGSGAERPAAAPAAAAPAAAALVAAARAPAASPDQLAPPTLPSEQQASAGPTVEAGPAAAAAAAAAAAGVGGTSAAAGGRRGAELAALSPEVVEGPLVLAASAGGAAGGSGGSGTSGGAGSVVLPSSASGDWPCIPTTLAVQLHAPPPQPPPADAAAHAAGDGAQSPGTDTRHASSSSTPAAAAPAAGADAMHPSQHAWLVAPERSSQSASGASLRHAGAGRRPRHTLPGLQGFEPGLTLTPASRLGGGGAAARSRSAGLALAGDTMLVRTAGGAHAPGDAAAAPPPSAVGGQAPGWTPRAVVSEASLHLLITAGPAAGASFCADARRGEQLLVGRHPGCSVPIFDQEVSSHHAVIAWYEQRERWGLNDTGSLNGTVVNGRVVSRTDRQPGEVVALEDGDRLAFGRVTQARVRCHPWTADGELPGVVQQLLQLAHQQPGQLPGQQQQQLAEQHQQQQLLPGQQQRQQLPGQQLGDQVLGLGARVLPAVAVIDALSTQEQPHPHHLHQLQPQQHHQHQRHQHQQGAEGMPGVAYRPQVGRDIPAAAVAAAAAAAAGGSGSGSGGAPSAGGGSGSDVGDGAGNGGSGDGSLSAGDAVSGGGTAAAAAAGDGNWHPYTPATVAAASLQSHRSGSSSGAGASSSGIWSRTGSSALGGGAGSGHGAAGVWTGSSALGGASSSGAAAAASDGGSDPGAGSALAPLQLLRYQPCRLSGALLQREGLEHRRQAQGCEDVAHWLTPLGGETAAALFCLYDGHHGRGAAEQARSLLPAGLLEQLLGSCGGGGCGVAAAEGGGSTSSSVRWHAHGSGPADGSGPGSNPSAGEASGDVSGGAPARTDDDAASGSGPTPGSSAAPPAAPAPLLPSLSPAAAAAATERAFLATDQVLTSDDGCTATVLLLEPGPGGEVWVLAANVGDSEALWVDLSSGCWQLLTEDHRIASNPGEQARLAAKSGLATQSRLYGLNIARMLGDRFLKEQDVGFSARPHVSGPQLLPQGADSALVIASDGLWDVVGKERAAQLVCSAAAAAACGGSSARAAAAGAEASQDHAAATQQAAHPAALGGEGGQPGGWCGGAPQAGPGGAAGGCAAPVAAAVARALMAYALHQRSKDDISIMALHIAAAAPAAAPAAAARPGSAADASSAAAPAAEGLPPRAVPGGVRWGANETQT